MTTSIPRQSIRTIFPLLARRTFSSSPSCAGEKDNEYADKPRWSYTPPGTKAPFSLRQIDNQRQPYRVNEDPAVLDNFYISLLGPNGDKKLSEEIKWLAVTHKSFDQGRRGFNDRLALLGKRIVQLQASLLLVQNPGNYKTQVPSLSVEDQHKTFKHAALEGLENLTLDNRGWFTHKVNISRVAEKYGLLKVLRWAPVKPNDLEHSGLNVVLTHTMYAIVGAIALERGGVEANEFARQRILAPQGLGSN
uniref:54S ribosomal protein L15, mitochondrial n=1 Tax=Talaromyces marneffei PM1 TaxID=1077442 RepID=A0A093XDM4_TALMA